MKQSIAPRQFQNIAPRILKSAMNAHAKLSMPKRAPKTRSNQIFKSAGWGFPLRSGGELDDLAIKVECGEISSQPERLLRVLEAYEERFRISSSWEPDTQARPGRCQYVYTAREDLISPQFDCRFVRDDVCAQFQ
jgi:hypothetical protein